MFDAYLRRLKDRLLAPLARLLGPRLRPNAVTVLAFMIGMLAAAAAAEQRYGIALALWMLNRLLDGLDGALARVHGAESDFGGYLDILLDFVVYAAVPIGLTLGALRGGAGPDVLVAALALLTSFYVNAASWMYLAAVLERRAPATADSERITVTMPPGFVAGAETVVFYVLFLLLPERLVALFSLMAALVGLTVVQRMIWAARRL